MRRIYFACIRVVRSLNVLTHHHHHHTILLIYLYSCVRVRLLYVERVCNCVWPQIHKCFPNELSALPACAFHFVLKYNPHAPRIVYNIFKILYIVLSAFGRLAKWFSQNFMYSILMLALSLSVSHSDVSKPNQYAN